MKSKFSSGWQLKIAAIFGLLSVSLGAFAAHGLEGDVSENSLRGFQTGVRYMMYHSIMIILLHSIKASYSNRMLNVSIHLFIVGILLFSGSLFLLTTNEVTNIGMRRFWGPITPIGGVFLILGWITCFLGFTKKTI